MAGITCDERRNCNDTALGCFGVAYVFEQRAKPLALAQKVLAFTSLLGPVSVGALVLTVGTSSTLIPIMVWFAGAASLTQTVIALWSLSAKWTDSLAYYVESKADNYFLATQLRSLADDTAKSQNAWRTEFAVLETSVRHRTNLDLRVGLTDEEKRMAMRAALREYERPCAACQNVPTSLKSEVCDVCGNFKRRRLKWLV